MQVEKRAVTFLSKASQTVVAQGIQSVECEGVAAMIGDLFADRRRLAVVEVSEQKAGLALMVWRQNAWRLLGVWNVAPVWIPAGKTKNDFPEYSHMTPEPPRSPFSLRDLDGDAIPELLVTFSDDGYRLGYAMIKKGRGEAVPQLLDVYSSRNPPQAREGYLLSFNDSGRKSWWGETDYYRWEMGMPVHVATWHDDAYDPDKSYWQVTRGESDTVLRVYQGFQIKQVLSDSDGKGEREAAYATVEMDWKPGQKPAAESPGIFEASELYFFERLTGIPAAAYHDTVNGQPIAEVLPLMKRLKVTVTGSKEAVLRLSPPVVRKRK